MTEIWVTDLVVIVTSIFFWLTMKINQFVWSQRHLHTAFHPLDSFPLFHRPQRVLQFDSFVRSRLRLWLTLFLKKISHFSRLVFQVCDQRPGELALGAEITDWPSPGRKPTLSQWNRPAARQFFLCVKFPPLLLLYDWHSTANYRLWSINCATFPSQRSPFSGKKTTDRFRNVSSQKCFFV